MHVRAKSNTHLHIYSDTAYELSCNAVFNGILVHCHNPFGQFSVISVCLHLNDQAYSVQLNTGAALAAVDSVRGHNATALMNLVVNIILMCTHLGMSLETLTGTRHHLCIRAGLKMKMGPVSAMLAVLNTCALTWPIPASCDTYAMCTAHLASNSNWQYRA